MQVLFDLQASGQLAAIQRRIGSPGLTLEEFNRIVPDGLLRITAALLSPVNYNLLIKSHKQASDVLAKARNVVRDVGAMILEHPHAADRFAVMDEKPAPESKGLAVTLHNISGLQGIQTWMGNPPALRPALRIGFLDRTQQTLLDTTLLWHDLFFVIHDLARRTADSFEAARLLANKGQLQVDNIEKIGEMIPKIDAELTRIRNLAPLYGIRLSVTGQKTQGSANAADA